MSMKVININLENKTFETEDGDIFPLVFDIDNSITIDEFQKIVDESEDIIKNFIGE